MSLPIYVPSPSSPSACSAATEDWMKGSEPPFLASALSLTWSGKPSQPQLLWRRWKQQPWIRHLCSRMSPPSTAQASLVSYFESLAAEYGPSLAASRAPRCPTLDEERVPMTSGGFGMISLASLKMSDPTTSSSKTYLASLPDADEGFLAYAAGLIDGEGSIMISRRETGKYPYMAVSVQIEMAAKAAQLLDSMHRAFGGTLGLVNSDSPKRSATLRWTLAGHEAAAALIKMLSYLRLKKRQAEIVIGLMSESGESWAGQKLRWTEVRLAAWTAARDEITRLNARGPQENPPGYIAERVGGRWVTRISDHSGERWETYSGRFPNSGTMRNGAVYTRPTLAPLTSASDSSWWPTPVTLNRKSRKAMTSSEANGRRSGGGNSSPPGLETSIQNRIVSS